jgi:hypothetical protein
MRSFDDGKSPDLIPCFCASDKRPLTVPLAPFTAITSESRRARRTKERLGLLVARERPIKGVGTFVGTLPQKRSQIRANLLVANLV